MTCPRCGYIRQSNDDLYFLANECPSCGMMNNNHTDNHSNAFSMDADGSEPAFRPSPVDAESLAKARQRVEKRLKERIASQKNNAHYNQTLELARKFATEGVKKRQEQWKQQREAPQESDNSPIDLSTESLTPGHDNDATDAKANAADPDAGPSAILDMTIESDNTPPNPRLVPSQEQAVTPQLNAASESEPVLDDQPLTTDSQTHAEKGHPRKRWQWAPGEWAAGEGLARLLPLTAWLILAAGICGAILSWVPLTQAEAGMSIQLTGADHSINLGLLLGFAYLVTGVLGFALFWISSLINRQLNDIHQWLHLQSIPQNKSTAIH